MASSTEMWSESSTEKNDTGWRAQRGWFVTDAANDEEARSAPPLADSGSAPIPGIGVSHPLYAAAKVRSLPVEPVGPRTKIVRAIYETPGGGSFVPPEPPLLRPAEIRIDWDITSETFSVDQGGVPVVNSAGFPFSSDPARDNYDPVIEIMRNEQTFPIQKAITYAGKVNDAPYIIPNVGAIDAGQGLCLPMRCGSSFFPNAEYIPIIYTIRLRKDGWDTRIKDQSKTGWYSETGGTYKIGAFARGNDSAVLDEVLLNGSGQPTDTTIKIEGNNAPVGRSLFPLPETYKVKDPVSGLWFLKFKRHARISFNGLL